nr:unnamed protein product [Digitaria exilis]
MSMETARGVAAGEGTGKSRQTGTWRSRGATARRSTRGSGARTPDCRAGERAEADGARPVVAAGVRVLGVERVEARHDGGGGGGSGGWTHGGVGGAGLGEDAEVGGEHDGGDEDEGAHRDGDAVAEAHAAARCGPRPRRADTRALSGRQLTRREGWRNR